MNYSEFYFFLKKWREAKRFPPKSGWPTNIQMSGSAWDSIRKLYLLTNQDNHEYETSMFFADGDTYMTQPYRGTTNSVSAKHSIQVRFVPDQGRKVYNKLVEIDGRVVDKDVVKPEKLPKKTQLGFLFNIHTHPRHVNMAGQVTYSFFSDTDIRSLLSSDAIISGLITDSFWLVGKTDNVISRVGEVGEELLYKISEKAFAGEEYLDDTIRQNMSRWGLVFYRGHFGQSLLRIS